MPINRYVEVFFRAVRKKKKPGYISSLNSSLYSRTVGKPRSNLNFPSLGQAQQGLAGCDPGRISTSDFNSRLENNLEKIPFS